MPATAAIDNETLDHLLSVVDEGSHYNAGSVIRKRRSPLRPIAKSLPQFVDRQRPDLLAE
jgi:hypothetical protein